jgi:sugar phosphate isomerase/epimerase
MDTWPIGVFTSIDSGLGLQLDNVRDVGGATIQLHAPRKASRTLPWAMQIRDHLSELGLQLTAVFGGFDGESYADIPTVARTVGLVPLATRAERRVEMMEISDFARQLECPVVALHLGFVPDNATNPSYADVIEICRQLCDHCRGNNQALHLETGQEPAAALLEFIEQVDRDNLFINFDPANMILYGAGQPIDALKTLAPYVRSVHCKDAKWSNRPGIDWGREVPLGEGEVGMERFLRTLKDIGYTGPLTIERELPSEPDQQLIDIQKAIRLLETLRHQILSG